MDNKNSINETNMKRYTKDAETKLANQIIIIKDDMQIINPTEAMILADGWIEYIEPEETEEQKLSKAIGYKQIDIEEYDTSPEINEFYVSDRPMWLDKATRAGLLLRFQAEQAQGITDTILWYDGQQFPLKVDQAIQMLYAIELYASACYDNTQRHLASIQALQTIEEIESYDYKAGYPEKLRF